MVNRHASQKCSRTTNPQNLKYEFSDKMVLRILKYGKTKRLNVQQNKKSRPRPKNLFSKGFYTVEDIFCISIFVIEANLIINADLSSSDCRRCCFRR